MHFALHSGRHSARDFCSAPLGLVHSYMHTLSLAWTSGSFLDPLVNSASLAQTGAGTASVAVATNPPVMTARKFCLDVCCVDETGILLLLLSAEENPKVSPLKHATRRPAANKIWVPMIDFMIKLYDVSLVWIEGLVRLVCDLRWIAVCVCVCYVSDCLPDNNNILFVCWLNQRIRLSVARLLREKLRCGSIIRTRAYVFQTVSNTRPIQYNTSERIQTAMVK